MAAHLFNRYVWLLEQVSNGGKTFQDISRAWERSSLNDKPGEPLPKRTFHNHIEEIREMFSLDIKCQSGYKYVLQSNDDAGTLTKTQEKLLNQLIASNLIMDKNTAEYIIMPRVDISKHISDIKLICGAISQQRKIKFLWGWVSGDCCMKERWVELEPYYINGYNDKFGKDNTVWYLFGVGSRGAVQIYGLKNIKEITMLDDTFEHPHTPFEEVEYKAFHTPISQTDDDDSFEACIDR